MTNQWVTVERPTTAAVKVSTVWDAAHRPIGEVRAEDDGKFGAYISDVLIERRDTRPEAAHAVLGAHFALQWPDTQDRAEPTTAAEVWPVQ